MEWVLAAFLWAPTLLLAIVIAGATRWLGRRLTPLLMPSGCLVTVVIGAGGALALGWLGRLVWPDGPVWGQVNPIAAVAGATLTYLALSIGPFIKTLFGRQ